MPKNPLLYARLKEHFGGDPAQFPIVEQNFAFYERANLHFAIGDLAAEMATPPKVVGIVATEEYHPVSLSRLSRPRSADNFDEGPVEHVDQALPNQQRVSCIKRGMYMFHVDDQPLALLIAEQHYSRTPGIVVEVMGTSKEQAEKFIHRLARLVKHGKAYRGHVLSLERDCHGGINIQFHTLPEVARDQVILPAELLDRIERHTITFSAHAKRLAAAKRHLKRGILLHGPPGTGKTYSAMYLASRMPGRTVFLMTGAGMGSIETACQMARILEPATIILEDVDLIGTQRDRQTVDANALLFELLNQMDGLADDADILFILTTNRPDVLEPALAARPGRIDQAIAVPPPDEQCRRRLFSLYSKGMQVDVENLDNLIRKLDGVSAAFIRELLRKAAVLAAIESDGDLRVRGEHLQEALEELLVAGGPLTQSLLGAKRNNGDT
jgi:hypothetical protein